MKDFLDIFLYIFKLFMKNLELSEKIYIFAIVIEDGN